LPIFDNPRREVRLSFLPGWGGAGGPRGWRGVAAHAPACHSRWISSVAMDEPPDGTAPGDAPSPVVGRVIGTEPATPLEFWVGVGEGAYLQLDDVVVVDRVLPDGRPLRISGVVSQVRAVHEGARMDSDVFLVADGVL